MANEIVSPSRYMRSEGPGSRITAPGAGITTRGIGISSFSWDREKQKRVQGSTFWVNIWGQLRKNIPRYDPDNPAGVRWITDLMA